MKIDIVKNTSRNIAFSFLKKFYAIIVSFLMRTLMIYLLSVEYVGLNGLFTSLLNILNLTELGIGNAIVYTMYKSVAEDDHEKICALLKTCRYYYKIIGTIILSLGLLCVPFLDYLIKGSVPENLNIYIIFLLYLLTTVSSYFMYAYETSVFNAYQRQDILNRIEMIVTTIKFVAQLIVLVIFKNYYYYLSIGLFAMLFKGCLVHKQTKKFFPQYKPQGNLTTIERKRIFDHVRAIFLSRIGGIVVNSADAIVISIFLGITVLGVYQNYFYILTAVSGIVVIFYKSATAGIGNKIIINSSEQVYASFENSCFWIVWICCICNSFFLAFFQWFIRIWVGKEMLLSYGLVIMLCIYFYIFQLMGLTSMYEDAAGIWQIGKFRPLLEGVLNLTLNIVLVNFMGLYGILLSTIISMALFSFPWLLHKLFKEIFKKDLKSFLKDLLQYIIWALIANLLVGFICYKFISESIAGLFLRLFCCLIIPNGILFFRYKKSEKMRWMTRILKKVLIRME